MSKVFVTDMDDVLVSLVDAWVDTLNKRYGTNVSVSDILEWDITKAFPTLSADKIFGVLNEEELWNAVQPKGVSPQYLSKLKEDGYTIYVCTATHYKNLDTKIRKCLLKYYPWLTYKDIIMCHNKPLLKCDYLVDDNPMNLIGSGATTFLMDAPYNQNCSETLYDFRVYSMEEVYTIIKQLEVVSSD